MNAFSAIGSVNPMRGPLSDVSALSHCLPFHRTLAYKIAVEVETIEQLEASLLERLAAGASTHRPYTPKDPEILEALESWSARFRNCCQVSIGPVDSIGVFVAITPG